LPNFGHLKFCYRRDIQDINWQRKSNQLNAGERLRELEATWVGLVSKNYDIEQACAQLEEEIALERQRREHSVRKRRQEDDSSSRKSKAKISRQEREEEVEEERVEASKEQDFGQEADPSEAMIED